MDSLTHSFASADRQPKPADNGVARAALPTRSRPRSYPQCADRASAPAGAEHHIADRTLRLLEYDAHTHAFKPETLIELPLTATLAELQQEVDRVPPPDPQLSATREYIWTLFRWTPSW